MEIQEIVRRTHRIAAMVAYSIFGAIVLYLVLEELIRNKMAPFHGFYPVSNPQTLRYLFYGLSAASIILARLLQLVMLRKKPQDTPLDLLNKLHRTSLVVTVMSEFPALFGLILFLIGGFNRDFYVLLAISVIVLFIFFPRRRAWEAWIGGKI
jgi:hypothetical protein